MVTYICLILSYHIISRYFIVLSADFNVRSRLKRHSFPRRSRATPGDDLVQPAAGRISNSDKRHHEHVLLFRKPTANEILNQLSKFV